MSVSRADPVEFDQGGVWRYGADRVAGCGGMAERGDRASEGGRAGRRSRTGDALSGPGAMGALPRRLQRHDLSTVAQVASTMAANNCRSLPPQAACTVRSSP